MELLIFVAGTIFGAVIGYYIEWLLDRLGDGVAGVRMRQGWKRVEESWRNYEALAFGKEVVQSGWNEGAFSEPQVVLTVDSTFALPEEIVTQVRNPHSAEWESQNLKDNPQYGITSLDPHRLSDETHVQGYASHQLRIHGHRSSYFDFLATHRMLLPSAPANDRLLVESIVKKHGKHYLDPNPEFPNVLSVGLSLFCENGNCLVLTHRTKIPSSGGAWSPNMTFNSVGENVTLTDTDSSRSSFEGKTRLSIWATAKRGLFEEMGIHFNDGIGWSLVMHTLAWDSRILDYNFFGYVTTPQSRSEVKQDWTHAPDRHENRDLIFVDIANKTQCLKLLKQIAQERTEWSSEAILCTIRSLLHLGKIVPGDLRRVF